MPISVVEVDAEQVQALLNTDEGHFIDLKAVDIKPASVTRHVSAFANTSGGEIVIGVDERIGASGPERVWRGFENPEAANGLIQALEATSIPRESACMGGLSEAI